ncbi:MAG: four helix bundle protein [Bacteroidales bacterium]|nr:four helix bundle protein [Bacteroidales bacterium]
MKTHKDLNAWKNSIDLVIEIYRLTKAIPKEELFCLTVQLRRAAISVPSNISEGAARNQKKEFIRYLRISIGSLAEIETQILIARHLEYISEQEQINITGNINKIRSQIAGLIRNLEQRL